MVMTLALHVVFDDLCARGREFDPPFLHAIYIFAFA